MLGFFVPRVFLQFLGGQASVQLRLKELNPRKKGVTFGMTRQEIDIQVSCHKTLDALDSDEEIC
jgi:hypothetical protein